MMYEVVSVEKKKRQYLVHFKHIDQHFNVEVSEEMILEYRLVKGKILDENQWKRLNESMKYDSYRQKLMRYLNHKPRTVFEAKKYLDQFDLSKPNMDQLIDRFVRLGVLNDQRYIEQYIEEYSQFRLMGPKKIFYDLINKGLNQPDIEQGLLSYPESLMKNNIHALIIKHIESSKNKSLNRLRESIYRLLMTKGYDYQLIDKVFQSMRQEVMSLIDEEEALRKDYQLLLKKYLRTPKKQSLSNFMIPKLIQKGYQYQQIIDMVKGEDSNEYE